MPDAISALARIIASLHDDGGNVAIPDLRRVPWTGVRWTEEEFRAEVGAVSGVELTGDGTIADRVWGGPAVAVLGIDAPAIEGSSNQIVAEASARISLRVAPGEDAEAASEKLRAFLLGAAPWGVQATIEGGAFEAGNGYVVDTAAPGYAAGRRAMEEAFGEDVVEMGSGGSIPLVPMLAETFPGIAVLMWGAMDERSNIHSVNESVDLGEIERMAVAEARFLQFLAGRD